MFGIFLMQIGASFIGTLIFFLFLLGVIWISGAKISITKRVEEEFEYD